MKRKAKVFYGGRVFISFRRFLWGFFFLFFFLVSKSGFCLPLIGEPLPYFFSLLGFKWNRPIFQTGGNSQLSYVLDRSDYPDYLDEDLISQSLNNAFATWEDVESADISFIEKEDKGGDYDYWDKGWDKGEDPQEALPELDPGAELYFANIIIGGWLPQEYFESLETGGGTSILGVTWIFGFLPQGGEPAGPNGFLDADEDGFDDFAFCEIYFNDYFSWEVNGSDYDIETVALHEIGHSLGLDHSSSPDAVMYPDYQGLRQELSSDDITGISQLYPIPEPSNLYLLSAGLISLMGLVGKFKKPCS